MPKHIESRQSRLGADQPGGFCVFFSESRGQGGGSQIPKHGNAGCASCVVKKPRKILQI